MQEFEIFTLTVSTNKTEIPIIIPMLIILTSKIRHSLTSRRHIIRPKRKFIVQALRY